MGASHFLVRILVPNRRSVFLIARKEPGKLVAWTALISRIRLAPELNLITKGQPIDNVRRCRRGGSLLNFEKLFRRSWTFNNARTGVLERSTKAQRNATHLHSPPDCNSQWFIFARLMPYCSTSVKCTFAMQRVASTGY